PKLVIPNFPAGTGIPRVILGGVNWAETKTQLEVAEKLRTVWGLETSAEHLYEITQMPPPQGTFDIPPGPKPAGGAPPVPGAPANPLALPSGMSTGATFSAGHRSHADRVVDELLAEFRAGRTA